VGLASLVPPRDIFSGPFFSLGTFGLTYYRFFGFDEQIIVNGWGNNSTIYEGTSAFQTRNTGNWEVVPEPATSLVFVTGLGVMGWFGWRRRYRAAATKKTSGTAKQRRAISRSVSRYSKIDRIAR
jgi:PEP-CTERM motif